MSALREHVGMAEVLLVVPPFGGIDRPSLGAHLLQACARQAGIEVDVFYANSVVTFGPTACCRTGCATAW